MRVTPLRPNVQQQSDRAFGLCHRHNDERLRNTIGNCMHSSHDCTIPAGATRTRASCTTRTSHHARSWKYASQLHPALHDQSQLATRGRAARTSIHPSRQVLKVDFRFYDCRRVVSPRRHLQHPPRLGHARAEVVVARRPRAHAHDLRGGPAVGVVAQAQLACKGQANNGHACSTPRTQHTCTACAGTNGE